MEIIKNDIIAEVMEDYRKMSLVELLADENMMAKCWHARKRMDPVRKKIQAILRSEIVRKLR